MKVWTPVLHSSLPESTHCNVYARNITTPVAVFLVPDWGHGYEAGYGVELSYRPAKLHRLASRTRNDNPTP
jgi:hypothetical protein